MSRFDVEPELFVELYENGELKHALVLDVRELEEWDYYHLPETTLMPMQTIPDKAAGLPQEKTLYVICGHGVRSAMVCNYLIGQGMINVKNVRGGMAAVAELRGFAYD